jgi:hypothetical protein
MSKMNIKKNEPDNPELMGLRVDKHVAFLIEKGLMSDFK